MDTAGVSKGWNACMNGPASGLKREALLDRKMRGILCPRRGRDTRPERNRMTRRVSLDTPGLGKRMLNGLPAGYGTLAGRCYDSFFLALLHADTSDCLLSSLPHPLIGLLYFYDLI